MDLSVMQIVRRTFPFILTRILIYVGFAVAAFLFLGLMIGLGFLFIKMFGETGGPFFIIIIIAFLVVWGGLRFLERYVLYMVKLGHVSVVTELLRNGNIPEGKGMVAYGKDKVTENFGASNVAFVMDAMVHAAVRQIQRWIMRVGNVFRFIPGAKNIIGIINAIMSISLNYIDEAIMSYVFLRKSEQRQETVWKSALDGVTLYAQSWKSVLKSATISVVFIYAFNILLFLIFYFPLLVVFRLFSKNTPGLGTLLGLLALVGAYILTTVAKRALIDPIVTIIMIRSYQISIRSLEPKIDLQQRLLGISSRFKRLFNKAREEEAAANQQPPAAHPHDPLMQ